MLAAGACVYAPASALAADIAFVDKAASDADNFIGDLIDYADELRVKGIKLGEKKTTEVCVPAGAKMRGIGKATLTGPDNKPVEFSLFQVKDFNAKRTACLDAKSTDGEDTKQAQIGTIVALDPVMLRKSPPDRYGYTFGTLVVPYKYQFKGDRSTSGGATLGGYVGYRATVYGSSTIVMAFAGATKVDVPSTKDGKPVIDSLAGLSYGVGVLGSIKDAFKLGVVVGADRVSKSANYVNNGKAWVSFSLGYDFFN